MTVIEHQPFRVTRNADIEMDAEDADDLLQLIEQELRAAADGQRGARGAGGLHVAAMRDFVIGGVDVDPVTSTPPAAPST